MAGRPKLKELRRRIRELDDDEMTGEERLILRISDGDSALSVAKEFGVHRMQLVRELTRTPELQSKFREATKESAHALAEGIPRIIDEVEKDRDAIAIAKMQVENRKWLAGVRDEAYRERQTVDVKHGFAEEFARSLEKFGNPAKALPAAQGSLPGAEPAPDEPPVDADYEVLEETEEEDFRKYI